MCKRVVRKRCLSAVASAAVLLWLATIAGCGGERGGPGKMSDRDMIAVGLITGFNPGDAEEFPSFFVDGAVPSEAERERYARYTYKHVSADISGDEATITVRVEDGEGNPVGQEVQWTAVKVKVGTADTWKLKQVKLPDAAK